MRLLLEANRKGLLIGKIAHMLKCLESEVYKRVIMRILRVYKLVDTCAAEFKPKHHIIILLLKMLIEVQWRTILLKMKVYLLKRKK